MITTGCEKIKLIGPESVTTLAEVHAEAFAKPWSADDLKRTLTGTGAFALASADDQRLRGFLIARAIAGEAEILTLAVQPQARRTGVGSALVTAAAQAARAFGAAVIWLEVAVDNAAAINLYQSLGFETAGRRDHYYARDGAVAVDALIMRHVLNTATA